MTDEQYRQIEGWCKQNDTPERLWARAATVATMAKYLEDVAWKIAATVVGHEDAQGLRDSGTDLRTFWRSLTLRPEVQSEIELITQILRPTECSVQPTVVDESTPCDPPNACATHGRCWTHSDWDDPT